MAFNKIIIEGRMVSDPELKQTASGVDYCNFTVAVDRDYKNEAGERIADFIPVKAWRGSAKFISQYFHKGDPILVDGKLTVDKYVDSDGNNKTFTQVVVDNATFTISKKSSGDSSNFQPAQPSDFKRVDVDDSELPF